MFFLIIWIFSLVLLCVLYAQRFKKSGDKGYYKIQGEIGANLSHSFLVAQPKNKHADLTASFVSGSSAFVENEPNVKEIRAARSSVEFSKNIQSVQNREQSIDLNKVLTWKFYPKISDTWIESEVLKLIIEKLGARENSQRRFVLSLKNLIKPSFTDENLIISLWKNPKQSNFTKNNNHSDVIKEFHLEGFYKDDVEKKILLDHFNQIAKECDQSLHPVIIDNEFTTIFLDHSLKKFATHTEVKS